MYMTGFADEASIDLDIQIKAANDLPNIYADTRLIRQIFINLITNAVKFSHERGKILANVGMLDDGRMQITIIDEGVGIPKEKINRAMEPFGQVSDNPENSGVQGTGLGLPLAKAMIELHDGTMGLESDVAKGTRVFVTIPAYRMIGSAQGTEAPSNPPDKDALARNA